MPKVATASKVRAAPLDKISARRAELVEATLQTLAELGYARASLREIAQKSRFSHGVLHYYFSDKVELITYCVRDYKAQCVKRYDEIMIDANSHDAFVDKFLAILAQTLREESPMHRLWYDLRSQALFEQGFRQDVQDIDKSLEDMTWRIVSRALQLRDAEPALPSSVMYAALDGLFQHALLRHIADDAAAIPDLQSRIREFLSVSGHPRRQAVAILAQHKPKERTATKSRRAATRA